MALVTPLWACEETSPAAARLGGNPERGRTLLVQYGCAYCHVIPRVDAPGGVFGPPLTNIGKRVYLAGVLPNSPENMTYWIRAPKAIKPQTAMPDLGVSETDARDMVAYLYRLR